jgi:hypothetical protein
MSFFRRKDGQFRWGGLLVGDRPFYFSLQLLKKPLDKNAGAQS